MNKPLVSVIIPNYCHSQFLVQRIESVLNQTYQNFEVIILDDCSPDAGASKAVIEKYRGNPHVSHIVYNEENSGSTFKQALLTRKTACGLWDSVPPAHLPLR
jgi:glycosyltransferase involved in cell wall biosynthesis